MPRYRFAVKDEWGRRKTGGMDAPDLEGARKRLLQGGFEVISLVEDGQPLQYEELARPSKPPPKSLIYVGLMLFALGAGAGLIRWLRPAIDQGPRPQPLKLVFHGRASGAGRRVVLDLPELPLHREAALKDGGFRVEVQLKVHHRPTYAWVQVTDSGPAKALGLDAESREMPSRKLLILKPGQAEYAVGDLKY